MTVKHNNRIAKCLLLPALALPAMFPLHASAAENPMDEVGVTHNVYLDCLQNSKDRSNSPLARLVLDCGFDPGMSTEAFVELYRPLIEMDPAESLAKRMSPYRGRYNDYEFSYFERIDKVVETARDPIEADAMFAALEREAVVKLDVKSHAGANILGGLSVARHSLKYWSEQPQSGGDAAAARWPRWLRTLVIVVSDIAGAVLATEVGAPQFAGQLGSAVSDAVGAAIP